MQNIPGTAAEKTTEQIRPANVYNVKQSDKQQLFADLFDSHANRVENELALAPVSTSDRMVDTAPEATAETQDTKQEVLAAAEDKAPVAKEQEAVEEEKADGTRDRDQRMTQEDFEEVKDDLKQYGLTDEEIAEIEEEINSEEGMTWGQFVSTLSEKMAEMRKVSLSDGQKESLSTFFAKFGFTSKESAKLIRQLESGDQAGVMAALQKKLDAIPEGKQLLFTKDEVEAFSAAMNFSKEFTSKIKEAFAKNMVPKEIKEAFTRISQEMADMDAKEQTLVRAVGKQFVKAMGNEVKESTAAKEINEAIDLKPRVAEDALKGEAKQEAKEEFKDAVEERREAMPANSARKTKQQVLPAKAETETPSPENQDSDNHWNNFFSKLQPQDGKATGGTTAQSFQAKTETIESMLKTGLAETNTKADIRAWEKVSAPKVMRQVENAFIQNLQNGGKQLSLQLTPEHLGKLSILLQVRGKEVNATIRAESSDAARLIADNIDIIRNTLEAQGLKVDKLEVQSGLSNDLSQNGWFGESEHNLAREREAMVAMRKHMKQMREGDSVLAREMQGNERQATVADQGLHIIA